MQAVQTTVQVVQMTVQAPFGVAVIAMGNIASNKQEEMTAPVYSA
jgi:hypothetical protein